MADIVPLFPLGATVLFPGMVLPLHIFEERYREMVRTLLGLPGDAPRRFGVVAIRSGWEVGEAGARAVHEVGCLAELRRVSRYPDGRYDIVTAGTDRFRLHGIRDGERPYLVGEVTMLPVDPPPGPDVGSLATGVGGLFIAYLAAVGAVRGPVPRIAVADLPDDPGELSYLVAATAVLALEDRQALLEATGAAERLRLELRMLKRESTMLSRLRALPTAITDLRVSHSLS